MYNKLNMVKTVTKPTDIIRLIASSLFIGIVVGFLYLCFEWVVNNGSNWLWNDLVNSDIHRWRVIPLALIMSIIFSLVLRIFGQKRVLKPASSLLEELNDIKKTSITKIVVVLVIGGLSLIAGASLGPEASLVAASIGVAAWISGKQNVLKQPIALVFSLASIGALLAAFFNSLLPIAIPLLILKQKGKLTTFNACIVIISGIAAWAVVRVIKNEAYIEIPVSGAFNLKNHALAVIFGFLGGALTFVIKRAIQYFFQPIEKINIRFNWIFCSTLFGLVLGLLYFIGGQTVQFSGSEGLKLLRENPTKYGVMALLGLVAVKLLATAWSTTTGYRGGLVFPSIYMGVTLSLAFSSMLGLTGATEAGTIIGAVTGVLMGMINPVVGIVLTLALFPFSLILVVLGGVVGSFVSVKLFAKLSPIAKS